MAWIKMLVYLITLLGIATAARSQQKLTVSVKPEIAIPISDFNSTFPDYERKTTEERNLIRLDITHQALLRLAKEDTRIDISQQK
jgi:hypothetical protein